MMVAATATTPPSRRRAWRWIVLAGSVLLAAPGLALWLLLGSAGGNAWLLGRLPGLTLTQPQGRVLGGAFSAEHVELRLGEQRVTVERLSWRDLRWTWRVHDGAWLGLTIDGLHADRVDIAAAPAGPRAVEPASLRLAVALVVDELRLGQLRYDNTTLASDIAARLEFGHAQGAQHRVSALAFRTARARVSGSASIAADAPFAVQSQLHLESAEGVTPRWRADALASGPLAAIGLQARLESPDAAKAQLDASATLSPFAAWPLSALQASTRELDLAALVAGAPQTRLSGQARIDTRGLDQPVVARITLTNAMAGRWDQQRLPLTTLELDLAGRADQRNRLSIQRFDVGLPAVNGAGARASGSGEWQADSANVELTLHALRPSALDARAPAMTLGGKLGLRLSGLPAPDGSRAAAAEQQLQATLALDGRLDAPRTEPVSLRGNVQADRSTTGWRVALDQLVLRAGTSELRGSLTASRAKGGATQLATQAEATGFNPASWWTQAPQARLNGHWQADLQAPASLRWPLRGAGDALGLRGQAKVDLTDSMVLGVPLQGHANLDGRRPGWSVSGDVLAAGNRLQAQGRLAAQPADDHWRVEVEAPAMQALRPLAAAFGGKTGFEGLDGTLAGQVQIYGRWPELRSTGTLRTSGLRAGGWTAQRLAAQWQAGPNRDSPLSLAIEGEQLAQGTLALDNLRAAVDGSLASHRIALDAGSALRPPAWTDLLLASASGTGSRLQLRADGRWRAAAGGTGAAGAWQAQVAEVDARGRDATRPWLAARDAQLTLQVDDRGRVTQATAAPGRAMLLGAAFVWREARWQAAAGERPPQWSIDGELEPVALVPVLQRWQPDAGFGGDLTVKTRVRAQRSQAFGADIVLERASGDLSVTDEGGTVALGLSDLRVAMEAASGTWHFTQAVAGSQLGVLVGSQSLRIDPAATWPAPESPMEGVLEWQVADLGVWARFTPPGWRLAGQLRTSAGLGGRFGAPEIQGRMEGRGLAIRNLLQGVDLREGELALSLRGADARVERFTLKGGDGELRLTGGAALGAEPSARLQLTADKFRLLGRADRRLVVSGVSDMALDTKSLALTGQLTIDEGLFDIARGDAPELDADVRVHGSRHGARSKGASTAEEGATARARLPARDVRLAVQVDLGRDLRLRGRGLDTRLAGRLALSAPQGRLTLNGQVRAQDGQYAAYGQKLAIERGLLNFTGEAENPRLDILAVRPNLDVVVGVQVSGTAQLPRVRLVSEPEMSEYDKLSWLVLGRASDGLARADTALLQRAALALLAGENESADAALLTSLGLDEFSVRQNDSGEVRETVVTLGKQLSRRWYVGYERSVNDTTGTWQLIYRAAQRFTLRAQSGTENSLDAIWTWRWN